MKIRSYSLLVVLWVAGSLLHFSAPASAQTLSNGCSFLNTPDADRIATTHFLLGFSFFAGETITFSMSGGSGNIQIEVPQNTIVASGPGPLRYTFSADFTGNIVFRDSNEGVGQQDLGCFVSGGSFSDDSDGLVAGPPCGAALDGRLNNSILLDCASPIALYTEAEDFVLYGIHPATGEGTYLLRIAKADIGDTPAENTLLAESANPGSGQPITLWHLSSGELQVNTTYADGKAYIFIFDLDGRLIRHYAS